LENEKLSEHDSRFTELQWKQASEEMRGILITLASRNRTIFYGDLSRSLTRAKIEPHDRAMGVMLGQISADEFACSRHLYCLRRQIVRVLAFFRERGNSAETYLTLTKCGWMK
jgi:hypothetical protein